MPVIGHAQQTTQPAKASGQDKLAENNNSVKNKHKKQSKLSRKSAKERRQEAREQRAKREEAFTMYRRSREMFDEGRFMDSAVLLRQAFELSQEPILLFNMGRSLEAAGELEDAVRAYDHYLQLSPDAKDRQEVEKRLKRLHEQIEEQEKQRQAQLQAEQRAAEAEQQRRRAEEQAARQQLVHEEEFNWVPWILAGVGVGGLAVGGVLGILSIEERNGADNAASQVEALEKQQSADDFALGSVIALAAGGTIAAAGVTWGVIDLALAEAPPASKNDKSSKKAAMSLRVLGSHVVLCGVF